MLLTITTTYQPATDLGYLLYKHPGRVQHVDIAGGQAHIFYTEATEDRCTAALLVDIDPVGLVRGKGDFALRQYVNDRPYVASSFMSAAIANVYGTALNGTSRERQELANTPIPLEATLSAVRSHGGAALLARLFEPLGYEIMTEQHALDPHFPDWGDSPYYTLSLRGTVRLAELLTHLYVLIPVLDDDKHYFVDEAEVKKLLAKGEGWLEAHPERELIAARYLKHQRSLTRSYLERLADEAPDETDADAEESAAEAQVVPPVERGATLHEQRLGAVLAVLKGSGATSVMDLGCGEGRLLKLLLDESRFQRIIGMDVSHRALERASGRLKLQRLPEAQAKRIDLLHGSLIYRDDRLHGLDAAAVVEVIEHLDPPRLNAFERAVFGFAHPGTVVITTPNREYNVMWESLPAGQFRHRDHRFEWTRDEFHAWATRVADEHGYTVRFLPVGPVDGAVGSPSQMGVFELADEEKED